ELIAQALHLFWIRGTTKPFGEIEELLLLALFSFDAVFDQLYDHTIGAKVPLLGKRPHLCRGLPGQTYTLANNFDSLHNTIMHQSGVRVSRTSLQENALIERLGGRARLCIVLLPTCGKTSVTYEGPSSGGKSRKSA